MQAADLKAKFENAPFRAFAIRLNNGVQYSFNSEREFGATLEYNMIFHLGERSGTGVDADSIVKIIESN